MSASKQPSKDATLPTRNPEMSHTRAKPGSSGGHETQLRFINASHPSEVRSTQNRKLIKQHAMLDAQQRKRETAAANTSKKRALKATRPTNVPIAPRQLLPRSSSASDVNSPKPDSETTIKVGTPGASEKQNGQLTADLVERDSSATIQTYHGWSSVDPFQSLPHFTDPRVRVEKLQYLNMAFFPSLKRSQQYVNAMISSPLVLLSDAHPGMILQDALDDAPLGGNTTLPAKLEIYTMINTRLRSPNPAVQSGRDVVAGIFNLIWLEISYGNLQVIKTHIQGLRRVFQQIGGMFKSGFDPNLMIMAVYQGLETAIYFEIPASPEDLRLCVLFQKQHAAGPAGIPKWESPVNSDDFSNTANTPECNPFTLHILEQTRAMTTSYFDVRHNRRSFSDFRQEAVELYHNLLRMNPANVPFLSTTDDWIYECVRIAAIIWATAIFENIPISIAVTVAAVRMRSTPQPIQALVQALKKTNTEECWNGMIGSFLWVCKLGCIAAPTGSVAFKWLFLEVARATVLGLRSRQYHDLLQGCETILKLQATLGLSGAVDQIGQVGDIA